MDNFNKEIIDEAIEVIADDVVPEAAANGELMKILAKLGTIGLGIGLGVTTFGLAYKKFGSKLDEFEARRLAKKGYVIQKPEAKEEPVKEAKK